MKHADFIRGLRDRTFEENWELFRALEEQRGPADPPVAVWRPTAAHVARSNIGRFMRRLGLESYNELWSWSVAERETFWEKVISHLTVTRPGGQDHFDDSYDLHCFDREQWRRVLRRAGVAHVASCDSAGRPAIYCRRIR